MITMTAWTAYARTGDVVGLAVVVDFPDLRNGATRASIDEWLNGAGRLTVRGYFHEVSGGRLNFTNIITPVITMDNPRRYYDIDRRDQPLSNERLQIFLAEVLNKLSRTNIDLSRITKDADNRVSALSILITGGDTPAQQMRGLRSHAGNVNRDVTIRGLTFRRYQISDGLGSGSIIPGIKTFIHETGHSLMGWPDLYNTIGGVSSGLITGARDSGLGSWCLMADYGMAPNPYFRHTAGWIDVTDITNARNGMTFTLNANADTALVYRRNEKEAFYIEARSQSADMGTYMGGIPARSGGLAIWHIDTDDSIERSGRFPVRLVQADGRNDLQNGANGGDDTDLFRAGVNQHFSSATHPAAVWTDGTPSGLRITGISASGPVMTFTIGDIPRTSANDFLLQVLSYANAQRSMVIELNQDITLNAVVNIPVPRNPDAALTIRSVNPARPVTIKRGHSGDLFRLSYGPRGSNGKFSGATLILENIILDGDVANYPGNSTPLVRVDGIFHEYLDRNGHVLEEENEGSTFIMNSGAVLRNNSGSGVVVQSNCVFTMNGGEISGNISNTVNVREVVFATFIMRETHISDSTGGGVNVAGYRSVITMNGGRIINNLGGSIRNVVEQNNITPNVSRIDLNGGVIVGVVTTFNLTRLLVPLIYGRHNLNGTVTALWNIPRRGSGSVIDTTVPYYSNGMFHYGEGSVTDLILSEQGAASWGLQDGVSGIVYRIGASAGSSSASTGFVPIAGVNVSGAAEAITTMAAFTGQIRAHAATRGDVVINVGRNLTIDTRIVIPAAASGGRLIIRSANPSSPVIFTRGVTGHLFTLSAGANVVLENIIIDGDGGGSFAAAGGVLIRVERGGSLTINDGVIVRNNTNLRLQGSGITVSGTLNMTGGEISSNITSPTLASSGGVSIDRYGTFIMSGGIIIGNTGGVSADRDSSFTMSGGAIRENMEHGVNSHNTSANQAVLTMTGGVICDNAKRGVKGTLTMSGGRISGNMDGGVQGSLIMSGGEISSNNTGGDGGGVLVIANGSFTMSGGIIRGNAAERGGGGVSAAASGRNSSVFVMSGGEITGNRAVLGGGVSIRGSSTFILENGIINGNRAVRSGGGVHVEGEFNMTGGEISGNSAERYSGGVDLEGVFNFSGGVIGSNTVGSARSNVAGTGVFNRTGGEIIDR